MSDDSMFEALAEEFEHIANRSEFVARVYSQSQSDRCNALLGFYRALWPITKTTPIHQWAMDPYEIDWLRLFTPIENALWCDIRAEGAVLYPQHPIAGYFVDFGHPVAKVAIECDGKEFHRDREKDAARQRAIEAKGWTVFRLTGAQCFSDFGETEDRETGEIIIQPGPARSLIRQVAREFRISGRYA